MTAPDGRGSMIRSPRLLFVALVLAAIFAFFYTHQQDRIPSLKHDPALASSQSDTTKVATPAKGQAPSGSSANVHNSTLGFQKIFVINLPERFDKLDSFSLAASLTGFDHEVIPGIKGVDVVNKTLPSLDNLPKKERSRNNIVGCWRAHMNFALKIVQERISSALVMEDDSDWDTSFKSLLADFATGARYIGGTPSTPHSPYGDDWDLLWLGHCSAQQHPSDQRRFLIENDITVPPMNHRQNFNAVPLLNDMGYSNSSRIVFRANNGVCLYSYALSYKGAQKMLRWQGKVKQFNPIDLSVGHQCRDDPNFKCIAVFPQLVDSHKAAGRLSRDSDIGTYDPTKERQKGVTQNIMRSTRLNIDNLIQGGEEKVEFQWPEDMPELSGEKWTRFD